jgi:asparagine synthase (glutamine-hydrolysing)
MTLVHTQYLLAARAGVGAVLDGIDADTLFSEGQHMTRLLRSGRWVTAWREAAGMAPFFGPGWPAWKQLATVAPIAFSPDVLKRSVRGLRRRRGHQARLQTSLIAADFAVRTRRAEPVTPANPADRAQPTQLLQERHNTIRCAALTAGVERYRRVASVHGIEPRHPFLDRRIVELCMQLPDRQRARDGWTKAVLRHAASAWLPAEVCWRRGKEHLGASFSQALFDRDQAGHLDEMWDRRDLLEPYVDLGRLARQIATYRRDSSTQDADLVLGAWALFGWLKRGHRAVETVSDPGQER